MAKVFSIAPDDRRPHQGRAEEIQEILAAKPEYVVNTSEFNDVKARLAQMHNRRKVDDKDDNRPKLKKAPGGGTSSDRGQGQQGQEAGRRGRASDAETPHVIPITSPASAKDGRPVLARGPAVLAFAQASPAPAKLQRKRAAKTLGSIDDEKTIEEHAVAQICPNIANCEKQVR